MDEDLEDRLAKINIENDMNRSLQLEMLLTSAKMSPAPFGIMALPIKMGGCHGVYNYTLMGNRTLV